MVKEIKKYLENGLTVKQISNLTNLTERRVSQIRTMIHLQSRIDIIENGYGGL